MKSKILVVDDDLDIRKVMKKYLSKLNYNVSLAESGFQAIEMIAREKFSLVLCDVVMPEMDGICALTEIKKIDKYLPVIMLSGYGTHEMIVQALNKGASDFIAKPIDLQQMMRIINEALAPQSFSGFPQFFEQPLSRDGQFSPLRAIVSYLEEKFPYLKNHGQRVAFHSIATASRLGLDQGTVTVIDYAAQLHDVGKICVKDIILTKPDKLDDTDWMEMKMHPELGSKMVSQLKIFRAEEPIIRHHHERYDGAGYPDGLGKEKIPLGARIIALADAYDAMTSPRPYHNSLSPDSAKNIIRNSSSKQFDPELIPVFLEVV